MRSSDRSRPEVSKDPVGTLPIGGSSASASSSQRRRSRPARGCCRRSPVTVADGPQTERHARGAAFRGIAVMIVSGTLLIADACATLLWQEPVSAARRSAISKSSSRRCQIRHRA